MPISATMWRPRSVPTARCASAISARMPPSPRLSARSTINTYFTVTTMMIDQTIRLRTPRISQRSSPSEAKCTSAARSA